MSEDSIAPSSEPPSRPPGSFAFVVNVNRLIGIDSYTLTQGHVLRRATPAEVGVIKEHADKFSRRHFLKFVWEYPWPPPLGQFDVLPEAEWRYFVIALAGNNDKIQQLQAAFDISPTELEIGPVFIALPGLTATSMMCSPGRLFQTLEPFQTLDPKAQEGQFVDVAAADLDVAAETYASIEAHDNKLLNISRVTSEVSYLKTLPHKSRLQFLGYFSILESLLTHSPKPSDPYDSITRQVCKKVALLDHRWAPPLDYSPFRNMKPDKVWKAMYGYRSDLAHGLAAEPVSAPLNALGGSDKASRLLTETVKRIVRHALADPQLMVDLRDC